MRGIRFDFNCHFSPFLFFLLINITFLNTHPCASDFLDHFMHVTEEGNCVLLLIAFFSGKLVLNKGGKGVH